MGWTVSRRRHVLKQARRGSEGIGTVAVKIAKVRPLAKTAPGVVHTSTERRFYLAPYNVFPLVLNVALPPRRPYGLLD